MGVINEHVDFTADTLLGSPYVQRIPLPANFTLAPKLVRFVASGATATGSLVDHIRMSEGWYDGSTTWVQATRQNHVDGSFSSNVDSYATTSSSIVILVLDEVNNATDDYAWIDSWGTDGGVGYVDIKWNAGALAPSQGYRCRMTGWAGSDFTPLIGVESVSGSVSDENTVTTTGVTPNVVRMLAMGATVTTGHNYKVAPNIGSGWAVSDAAGTPAIQQFAVGWICDDADTTPDHGLTMFNSEEPTSPTDRCFVQANSTASSSGLMELELTDADSGSFKYTIRNASESLSIGWVAMDLGDAIPVGIGYHEQRGTSNVPPYEDPQPVSVSAVDGSGTFAPQSVEMVASDTSATGYASGNLRATISPYCATSLNHHDDLNDVAITTGSSFAFPSKNNTVTDIFNWCQYENDEFVHVLKQGDGSIRWRAEATITSTGFELDIDAAVHPSSTTKVTHFIAFGRDPILMTGAGVAVSVGAGTAVVAAALTGAGPAVSVGTGTLEVSPNLTGAGSSTSTADATLEVSPNLVGAGASTSSADGTLEVAPNLVGAGASSSTADAALEVSPNLTGTGASTSTADATLEVSPNLVGAGSSSSSADSALTVSSPFDGAGASTSSGDGTLEVSPNLVGAGASTSTADGTLTVGGQVLLPGAGASTSTGDGSLVVASGLVGAGSSASTADATLEVSPNLVGAGASASTADGTLEVAPNLTGSGTSTSVADGTLEVSPNLVGAGASTSTADSALTCDSPIAGAGAAISAGDGSLAVSKALTGAGASVSTANGTLFTGSDISGAGASTSAGDGTISVTSEMVGSGQVTSVGGSSLTCDSPITGAGASVSTADAGLVRTREIAGAGASSSTADATLEVSPNLTGAGASTSAGDGTLLVGSDMSGAGASVSSSDATLTASRGLTGTGATASSGDGAVESVRGLTGAGASTSTADGTLEVGSDMSGAGASSSSADATLTVSSPFAGSGTSSSSGDGTLSSTLSMTGVGATVSSANGSLVTFELQLIGEGSSYSAGAGVLIASTDWKSLNLVTEELVDILEQDPDLRAFRASIRAEDGVYGLTERRVFPPYIDPSKNLFAVEERNMPYVSVSPIDGRYLATKTTAMSADTEITRRIVCIMPRTQYPSYEGDSEMKQAYILLYRALFSSSSRARLEALGVESMRMIRTNMDGLSLVTPQPAFAMDIGMGVKGERFMA